MQHKHSLSLKDLEETFKVTSNTDFSGYKIDGDYMILFNKRGEMNGCVPIKAINSWSK